MLRNIIDSLRERIHILRRGRDVYVAGLVYDEFDGELEIYFKHFKGWTGVKMDKEEAARIIANAKEKGVFFIEGVRHILVKEKG